MFPKLPTTSDSDLLILGDGWTASEVVDETNPIGEAMVDGVQVSHLNSGDIASLVEESSSSTKECSDQPNVPLLE
ncbi:hypothetical protein O181_010677 [Austropuccinia psidii MF-1]|uniref:Uncharacterized protein n=1 Tax=Austropuccinia psidii MF-1 TaxID=1389203 RepID=A0A9Q3BT45_9BASI|nr:hypothetical protein [Austropuccinia psidii MF-1]